MRHLSLLLLLSCLSLAPLQAQEHTPRHQHEKTSPTSKTKKTAPPAMTSQYPIPSSLKAEHEELHQNLAALTRLPGKTGTAAKAVADLLHPHFIKEEEFALPNLGLLPQLSQQKVTADMRQAVALSEKLRKALPEMLKEHQQIVAALQTMVQAAKAEKHPEAVVFGEKLMLHARTEEEVLYPTAILIGDYVKLKL
jgi:hypothetical protein